MIRTARSVMSWFILESSFHGCKAIDLNVDRPIEGHLVPHVDIRHDREGHGKDVVTEVVMLVLYASPSKAGCAFKNCAHAMRMATKKSFRTFMLLSVLRVFVKGLFRSQ